MSNNESPFRGWGFKLGDFVRFVDEKREGYITKIIDDLTENPVKVSGFLSRDEIYNRQS